MGGRASRQKGMRGELELQKLLHGARIRGRVLTARKVPLSGMCPDFKGDLMVGEECGKCEGKGFLSCIRYDLGVGKAHEDLSCPDCGGTKVGRSGEEVWEVKRRASGFKMIDKWLEDAAVVCYRRDRGEWIVTMRLSDLVEPPE